MLTLRFCLLQIFIFFSFSFFAKVSLTKPFETWCCLFSIIHMKLLLWNIKNYFYFYWKKNSALRFVAFLLSVCIFSHLKFMQQGNENCAQNENVKSVKSNIQKWERARERERGEGHVPTHAYESRIRACAQQFVDSSSLHRSLR